jgi:hypothetical protein
MCGTGERLIKFRATRVAVRRQLADELIARCRFVG